MKKLLLLLAFVPSAIFGANKAAEEVIKFMQMEQAHKKAWIDYKKANFGAKMDLVLKHKDQWFELEEKFIKKLGEGDHAKTVLGDQLSAMVQLHEKQNKEWADMCMSNMKKATEIAKKESAEINAFKKTTLHEIMRVEQIK